MDPLLQDKLKRNSVTGKAQIKAAPQYKFKENPKKKENNRDHATNPTNHSSHNACTSE
jgi:hypothetical protein